MTSDNRRKVVANISLSLDGRVNGVGGDYDMGWVVPHAITDTARTSLERMADPAATVLLGRKNYESFGGYWPAVATDETADPRDRAWARWLDAVDKVVLSATLRDAPWSNSRIVNDSAASVVATLREQDGGDILVLSSSSVIRALLAADEVDRLTSTCVRSWSGAAPGSSTRGCRHPGGDSPISLPARAERCG